MSCPDCFSGSEHNGTPKGKMVKLHGLDTYVTEPPEGRPAKGIIVIIPDAFGIDFINNKILADIYAAKGDYKVYLPDFMRGHSMPTWIMDNMDGILKKGSYLAMPYHIFWAMWGFIPWILRNRPGKSFPIVKKFFEDLRRETGPGTPIGAAGFCWGGKHVVLLADAQHKTDDGRPMYDAGFTGHPSFLEIPKDIERISVPVSFAVPELDNQFKIPRDIDIINRIMEGRPEASKGEVKLYEKVGHGFCVRADMKVDDVAKSAAEAEDQAIAWFNAKLGRSL
ncbi:Alpha/Beta hydrolase protein [Diaporthe sp. PMI_573]|nr:Alpha/Beta hydrolase protein [Diaporthaceae sp. PMI_573]